MAADDRSMIERVRERKERHKQRSKPYRIGFAFVGGLVILAGLALSLPGIPGPGLLLVAVGLGMLALEFDRAERLLEKVLVRLEKISERAKGLSRAQQIGVTVALVLLAAGAVAAMVVWGVPFVPDDVAR